MAIPVPDAGRREGPAPGASLRTPAQAFVAWMNAPLVAKSSSLIVAKRFASCERATPLAVVDFWSQTSRNPCLRGASNAARD
jgi:hypothetical protein